MQVIVMKMRLVPAVAVDTGIDQLIVKAIGFIEDPEQGGRGVGAYQVLQESIRAGLGGYGRQPDKEHTIKDQPLHAGKVTKKRT